MEAADYCPGKVGKNWDWLDKVNGLGVGVRGKGRKVSEPWARLGVRKRHELLEKSLEQ